MGPVAILTDTSWIFSISFVFHTEHKLSQITSPHLNIGLMNVSSDFRSNLNFNLLIMLLVILHQALSSISADAKNHHSKDKYPSTYDSLLPRLVHYSYKGMDVKVCQFFKR